MSKNMTRKGLAFGAGLALIGSGIVALPAQASGTITLGPDAGTSYNTLTSSTFTLMPIMAGVASVDYKYLRYSVSNLDEASFRFDIRQGATGDGEVTYQTNTASTAATKHSFTTTNIVGTDGTSSNLDTFTITSTASQLAFLREGDVIAIDTATASGDLTSGTIVASGDWNAAGEVKIDGSTLVYLKAANTLSANVASTAEAGTITLSEVVRDDAFVVVPDAVDPAGSNVATIGGQNFLDIQAISQNTTSVLSVQAWIDGNQNNRLDSGEVASAVRTVTFLPVSTLSFVASLDVLYASATTATVSTTITGDINYEQIDSGDVTATLSGGSITGTVADQGLAWNAVTGRFQVGFSGLGSIDSGETITATIEVDNDYNGSVDNSKATTTRTVATTVADVTFEASVVNSATAVSTQSSRSDTGSGGDVADFATRAGTGAVLEGSTGFDVSMFVGTDAVTAIGIGSVPVQVTVTSSTITATDAVTVGGLSLVSGTARTLNITTDANGRATIPVTLGAADDDDTITFAFAPYGTSLGSSNLVVTVTDNSGDYVLTQAITGNPSIKAGDTLNIEYRVVDLFGKAPLNQTHSVLVSPTANERTKAPTWSVSIPVVDGKAVLSVKDDGTGNGRFTAAAKLVVNGTTTALTNGSVDTVVNVVADPAVSKLTLRTLTYGTSQANDANNDGDFADTGDTDNTSALLLESRAFANFDSRYAIPTASAPTVRDTHKVVVGATATNAAGTAVAGAPVTFAAKGFLFKSGTRFVMDSITVHAGSTGIASVEAWSQVGGAQKVTITSGTATVDQALTFAAGTATAASFDITTVATSMPGKTVDVKVTVKDRFGNPAQGVTVALRSTGPGYLLQTSITTDRLGEAFTKLLVGASESGSAVVTATMTIAGVETSKAATVVIGGGAEAKIGSFNGRVAVRVENGQGSTVSVKIGRQWYKFNSLNDNYLWSVRSVKGRSVAVSVYINGDLQNVQTITVR